ncbi:MAG: hypothetical protein BGP08_12705 [Rhizobiales bacterium 64-17]|nr:MAG: hypothetical protein BGP08_12705 [Rhizobiales bacterium 64-17]
MQIGLHDAQIPRGEGALVWRLMELPRSIQEPAAVGKSPDSRRCDGKIPCFAVAWGAFCDGFQRAGAMPSGCGAGIGLQ